METSLELTSRISSDSYLTDTGECYWFPEVMFRTTDKERNKFRCKISFKSHRLCFLTDKVVVVEFLRGDG